MKAWFAYRISGIAVASAIIYFMLNNLMAVQFLKIPSAQLPLYSWLFVSLVWVIGLVMVKWQFSQIDQKRKKPFDFKRFLTNQKKSSTGEGKSLLESAIPPLENPSEKSEHPLKPNENPGKVKLENIVEGIAGQSLAEGEVSLDLEIEQDTELQIFGHTCKVKKGNVKIRPHKTRKERLDTMFPTKKRRKRVA